jgi:hypothetical protein
MPYAWPLARLNQAMTLNSICIANGKTTCFVPVVPVVDPSTPTRTASASSTTSSPRRFTTFQAQQPQSSATAEESPVKKRTHARAQAQQSKELNPGPEDAKKRNAEDKRHADEHARIMPIEDLVKQISLQPLKDSFLDGPDNLQNFIYYIKVFHLFSYPFLFFFTLSHYLSFLL